MESGYHPHMASPAFQDLDENRISPDEYARRTRREVEKLVREAPAPQRRLIPSGDDEGES